MLQCINPLRCGKRSQESPASEKERLSGQFSCGPFGPGQLRLDSRLQLVIKTSVWFVFAKQAFLMTISSNNPAFATGKHFPCQSSGSYVVHGLPLQGWTAYLSFSSVKRWVFLSFLEKNSWTQFRKLRLRSFSSPRSNDSFLPGSDASTRCEEKPFCPFTAQWNHWARL